jgi:poly(A) polymerase
MREIWLMQPRFERRSGSGPFSLVEQPRYRAGFDFLRLRADAGDAEAALADWWEDFALGSDEDRSALVEEAKVAERSQPRAEGVSAAPAKKRRRRRGAKKPGEAPAEA